MAEVLTPHGVPGRVKVTVMTIMAAAAMVAAREVGMPVIRAGEIVVGEVNMTVAWLVAAVVTAPNSPQCPLIPAAPAFALQNQGEHQGHSMSVLFVLTVGCWIPAS